MTQHAAWHYTLRKAAREFSADRCINLAAALTFYAVLSIFPAVIAVISLLSLVGQEESTDILISMAADVVPASAMGVLQPVIEGLTAAPAPGWGLAFGLLAALWTASVYVYAYSGAMNVIYEVPEGRPLWKLRPAMFGLTLVMLLFVAVAAVLLVISGPIAEAIGSLVGLGRTAMTVWTVARWPVLLLVVAMAVAMLYHFTPNVRRPKFRWLSLGAVSAIVLAVIASLSLGAFVVNFGRFNELYGSLAGAIVALLWLWAINLALLFGAEFDAELERSRQLLSGLPAEETIQLPARDTRASTRRATKQAADVTRGRKLRESQGQTEDEHQSSEGPHEAGAAREA